MNLTYSKCIKKHNINYKFKVLLKNRPTWFPYNFAFSKIEKNFLSKNSDGEIYYTCVNGLQKNKTSVLKLQLILKNLFSISFYVKFFKLYYNLISLHFSFNDSKDLDKLRINNVLIGDIVVAEYLRNKKFGNGILKFNFRFYVVCLKYLIFFQNFDNSINKLLRVFLREEIRFSIQETSFIDEFLRRILISKKIYFEFVFDKYSEKFKLFEYNKISFGRANEYTPNNVRVSSSEILNVKKNMEKRFSDGIQFWTGNVTDVNTRLELGSYSESYFTKENPIAVLFLQAVADDQFRCGFDCFKTIDDFHHFTINSLLELGYYCILKPHPGIVSPIHPDKSLIDYKYVKSLYGKYGLDYDSSLKDNENLIKRSLNNENILAFNPRLSLNAISKKIKFIVLTHHGNVTFEALHLNIPNLKYKYCKSRSFHFTNSWSNKKEYCDLLLYYKKKRILPKKNFKDDFYKVLAILSKKKNCLDYNKIFFSSYNEYFNNKEIKLQVDDINQLENNIKLVKSTLEKDINYKNFLLKKLNILY